MGRPAGKKRRLKKKFNYQKDRKKLRKKEKRRPGIECAQIKAAWAVGKSVRTNMESMGLVADPNKTFRIPTTKEVISKKKRENNFKARKMHVCKELEEIASIPHIGKFEVPSDQALFAKYMIETYGEDYKAMARDPRNHFQLTPKQIQRKIKEYIRFSENDKKSQNIETMDVS